MDNDFGQLEESDDGYVLLNSSVLKSHPEGWAGRGSVSLERNNQS